MMKSLSLAGAALLLLAGCSATSPAAAPPAPASAPSSVAPSVPSGTPASAKPSGTQASGPGAAGAASSPATSPPASSAGSAPAGASAASSAPAASSGAASAPAASSSAGSASPAASSSAASAAAAVDELSIRAIQQVGPGVVKITHPVQGQGQALGSGTIIDAKGYILTNAHVAEGATTYQVTLANNKVVQGKLIGLDPFDDLAVIQIGEPDLPVVDMGDSSKLQVGQTVLAIGNPIGFTRTVTSGIVSALDRTITEPPSQVTGQTTTIPNMIQTSAPINPGNSGGALIDLSSRIIGVPTLAPVDPELGGIAQGIAFAVPINRAKVIIPQLIANGRITHSGRAFLGVATEAINAPIARAYRLPVTQGLYVAQVVSGSAADQAGLKVGDIITQLDGKDILTSSDLADALLQKQPGDKATIRYFEGTTQKTMTVTLQEAPANQG